MSEPEAPQGAQTSAISSGEPAPVTASAGIINNNNVTVNVVVPPTPRAAAPRRGRAVSPPREASPRASAGFNLDASTVNVEGARAEQNDTNRDNVTTRIDAQESSYKVSEERRRYGGNDSLQSVGAYADAARPVNSRAFVISSEGDSKTTLEGYANGTVMLTQERNGIRIRTDITGANRDITAAGIRLLERNTAADGEVDRIEQQAIISLVDKAKQVVANRP